MENLIMVTAIGRERFTILLILSILAFCSGGAHLVLYYFYLINGEITDETGFYSGEGCWGALIPIITASVGLNTYCKVVPVKSACLTALIWGSLLSGLGGCFIAVFLIFNHGWKQLTFGNDESICPDIGERSYCTACISLWVVEASLLIVSAVYSIACICIPNVSKVEPYTDNENKEIAKVAAACSKPQSFKNFESH